jgi:phenylpyruvate tautomerase PptA (4-oxalocrotonate tautomerase family)
METAMPLVHISLIRGKSAAYIRAISQGVHQALTETYNVPADDHFQLIHQHDESEFIFDPGYLGISRTSDAVFIHIVAGKWRDTPMKQRFYARLAQLLAADPGMRPEDVQIILSPNDRDDWSFGKGLASYVTDPRPIPAPL